MEELKVTFYLKKNEERADGTVPILGTNPYRQVNGTVQHQGVCHSLSMGTSSLEGLWAKARPAAATNKELDRISLDIHSAYKDLLAKKETVSALEVKKCLSGHLIRAGNPCIVLWQM